MALKNAFENLSTEAKQDAIIMALASVGLDATTLAALETTSVANFPASQVVTSTDLDIRNLGLTDKVTNVDAAEDTNLLWEPIDFNTAGAHTIMVVAPAQRLRLRRFLLTGASVPSAEGDPILSLTLGGKSLRATLLIGRFDILGDAGEDLIITSSKSGQIDGTVGYTLESA